ncbi:MAG TPA: hypothetical protein VF950_30965 [Planctomycetota bacterium]
MGTKRATVVVAIFLCLVLAAIIVPGLLSSQRASNERSAAALLKVITSAEADFRGNDRDKNGVQDFWTKDVAGLYGFIPAGEREPLQLISVELAKADPSHPGAIPFAGYWHEAMDQDEDGKPYRQGDRNPSRFGFRARPGDPSTGRNAFYINDGNTIFQRSTEFPLVTRWPTDAELKSWSPPGHPEDCRR